LEPTGNTAAVADRSQGALLERLRGGTARSAAPIIREWLGQVLREVLDMTHESFGANQNLLELGFDSLRVLDLLTVVEEQLQLRCAPAELISRPTLAAFSDYLAERIAGAGAHLVGPPVSFGAQRSPLVAINGNGSRAPLFCVHPAGGEITCYLRLRELLGPDQPLYGIRSRGLDEPRREHASLESLAIDYATLIQTQDERGPYLLFGWSMGALVCHAVAGELQRRGARVSLVTMVDPPRPGATEERDSPADVLLAVRGICHELQLPLWTRPINALALAPRSLSQGGPAAVHAWCVRERLIPENAIAPDAFERSLDLRLRQHRLVCQYQPRRIDAPIEIWWAGAMSRGAHAFDGYSAVQPRHESVEADHFTIMQRPALDRILRGLAGGVSQ
jgi:thioesterase domain-containing protein/aryl carrier-like protein